jgi:hypothetical protein
MASLLQSGVVECSEQRLALGELEALTSTRTAWLLTLFHTGITSEQASLLQHGAMLWVLSDQSTSDTETNGPHLTSRAAASGVGSYVHGLASAGEGQWCQKQVLKGCGGEVIFKRTTVDGDFAIARRDTDAGDGVFAATSGGFLSCAHEVG